jgi:hypothetical protein
VKEAGNGLGSTNQNPPAKMLQDEDTFTYKNKYRSLSKFPKKSNGKSLCPFACPNCESLGGTLVQSKYEVVNVISDTGDSIFSPLHEKYRDDGKSTKSGRVFIAAEVVDPYFKNLEQNRRF